MSASVTTYHSDMRSAFRAKLIELVGTSTAFPSIDQVEWEGEEFRPTIGTPWMRERQTVVYSIPRAHGVQEHKVLHSVTLFFPPGGGTLMLDGPAGKIAKAFTPGVRLEYGESSAWTSKAEAKSLITEPDWVSLPIVIETIGHTYDR